MKIKSVFTNLCLIAIFLFAGMPRVSGQVNQIGQVLAAGLDDAEKLAGAYITPFANGFGATLNSGWYNSAKPHSLFGFDLTLTTSVAFVPTTAKSFDLDRLGLSGEITSANSISPTAAGAKKDDVASLRYTKDILGSPQTLVEFDLPKGTGLGFIPAPMISLGIGLIKDTDIKVRYIPTVGLSSYGDIGLWGIGIKHSLKQWIPVLKRIPVFNLSLQGGYTSFNLGSNLNFKPDPTWDDRTTGDINFDNQRFDMNVKSFTANVLVSADIPVITVYGGLGISSTNTSLKFKGYYPIPDLDETTGDVIVTNESVGEKDPLNITIKNKSGSAVAPRLNAGFKLKMAVITLHADYTYSDYSVVTAGLGISFR